MPEEKSWRADYWILKNQFSMKCDTRGPVEKFSAPNRASAIRAIQDKAAAFLGDADLWFYVEVRNLIEVDH